MPCENWPNKKDIPLILNLITELAIYEKEPDAVLATEESLLDTLGFKENSKRYAKTLLIFDGMKPAGMALWVFEFYKRPTGLSK